MVTPFLRLLPSPRLRIILIYYPLRQRLLRLQDDVLPIATWADQDLFFVIYQKSTTAILAFIFSPGHFFTSNSVISHQYTMKNRIQGEIYTNVLQNSLDDTFDPAGALLRQDTEDVGYWRRQGAKRGSEKQAAKRQNRR